MEKVLLSKDQVLGRRIGAFIADHFIISIISMVLAHVVTNTSLSFDNMSEFYRLFSVLMIIGIFCILCKDVYKGRSIGKMVFGLYVREYENAEEIPKLYKHILRNILTPLWFVEFLVLMTNKEGRRLGDKIAGTQVVGFNNNITKRVIIASVLAFAGFFCFAFFGGSYMNKNESVYKTAINYIENQSEITNEIGEIQGFGFSPEVSYHITNGYGNAKVRTKIKGELDSIIVEVLLEIEPDTDWIVTELNFYK